MSGRRKTVEGASRRDIISSFVSSEVPHVVRAEFLRLLAAAVMTSSWF